MDKEKIKYYTEMVKIFWTILIVLVGGLATLFIHLDSLQKYLLFSFGIFLSCIIVTSIYKFNQQIHILLNNLEN